MAEPMEGRKAPTHAHWFDRHTTYGRKTHCFNTHTTINNKEITRNDICESNNIYNLTVFAQ